MISAREDTGKTLTGRQRQKVLTVRPQGQRRRRVSLNVALKRSRRVAEHTSEKRTRGERERGHRFECNHSTGSSSYVV